MNWLGAPAEREPLAIRAGVRWQLNRYRRVPVESASLMGKQIILRDRFDFTIPVGARVRRYTTYVQGDLMATHAYYDFE